MIKSIPLGNIKGAAGSAGQTGATGETGRFLNYVGKWDGATTYISNDKRYDIVLFQGKKYSCKKQNINIDPTNAEYWEHFSDTSPIYLEEIDILVSDWEAVSNPSDIVAYKAQTNSLMRSKVISNPPIFKLEIDPFIQATYGIFLDEVGYDYITFYAKEVPQSTVSVKIYGYAVMAKDFSATNVNNFSTIRIQVNSGDTVSFYYNNTNFGSNLVDWGDGTVTNQVNDHTYETAGTYDLKIKGKLERDDGDSNFGVFASRYGSSAEKNGLKSVSCYEIGTLAFAYCQALSSVTFLKNIPEIPDRAFIQTSSLRNIELPSAITRIGIGAFEGSGLTGVSIPSNVETIDNYAFELCLSLKNIKIPKGVQTIGNGSFRSSGLTSITIDGDHPSLQYIGSDAFDDLGFLQITYGGKRDEWDAIQKEQYWAGSTTVRVKCSDD